MQHNLLINGELVAGSGEMQPVYNPATGEVLLEIAEASPEQVDAAVQAADRAFRTWGQTTPKARAECLLKLAEVIEQNAETFARLESLNCGKPLHCVMGDEIPAIADVFRFFAGAARTLHGSAAGEYLEGHTSMIRRDPVGVVASIAPWNYPLMMAAWKLGPALAAGCGFVGRPAAETPLSALALAVLAERAGVPKGLFSIVTSSRSSDIGKEFCENPLIRKLTFTGSTEVGRILLRQAADQVLKCSMELGGNAPFIVFDDADLDAAVEGAMASKFRNNGQTCVCANRIYVQAGVYDAFARKLAAAVDKLRVGDGLSEDVTTGPLINAKAVEKVEEHIQDALDGGATIVTGGKRKEGLFFEPTVVTGITDSMKVSTEETFGPLAPLFRFDTEDEAIARANDTIFGLAAYFYARDIGRVTRVQEALEYGIVGVNTGIISTEVAPFGGVKQSGLGREGSRHGIEDYLEMKYICLSI